jgi:hypothetical protein
MEMPPGGTEANHEELQEESVTVTGALSLRPWNDFKMDRKQD